MIVAHIKKKMKNKSLNEKNKRNQSETFLAK